MSELKTKEKKTNDFSQDDWVQKYHREIAVTIRRVQERFALLTSEERQQFGYVLEPRNKAEEVLKEDMTAFIAHRISEGMKEKQALEIARLLADEVVRYLNPASPTTMASQAKNLTKAYWAVLIMMILLMLASAGFLIYYFFIK